MKTRLGYHQVPGIWDRVRVIIITTALRILLLLPLIIGILDLGLDQGLDRVISPYSRKVLLGCCRPLEQDRHHLRVLRRLQSPPFQEVV